MRGDGSAGGQVGRAWESKGTRNGQADRGCGLGSDSWRRGQDRSKREATEQTLDFVSELGALGPQVLDGGTDTADDGFDRVGADYRDALLLKGGEDVRDKLGDATVSPLPSPLADSSSTCPAEAGRAPVLCERVQGALVGQPCAGKDSIDGRLRRTGWPTAPRPAR